MVPPVFVLVVLFFALLMTYPWQVLTIGTVIYLASLPFGWVSYRATSAGCGCRRAFGPAAGPLDAAAVPVDLAGATCLRAARSRAARRLN